MTLDEAHEEIRKYIEKADVGIAIDLMAQCQEGAIAIGNSIEDSEDNTHTTIKKLEKYCESLYFTAKELQSGKKVKVNNLKKHLDEARFSFNQEIRAKIEVVFFPYKASMWDSLESIWLAAKEDNRCECFVVPIPYFDRNPDGSFGRMHYEGELFPDYVQITDWRTYDIATFLPDIAYIHNPYDQYNLVTSVHPNYYSPELKKYIQQLVYVPYYATSGDMALSQYRLSAYYNVDKIIIQSERHRKYFDQNLPSQRLLPLGTPKFDRIIRLTRERPNPPIAWEGKMKGKKVYFYNTSISGFLENTQVFLKKMAYVFNCFRDRKDALLLWRPHPLLESTLDSMRPQFKQTYLQLKRAFFTNEIGIYDDTPDVSVSIALSDVYIGDAGTSITSLFGVAGKPQFILNNNIDREPNEEDLTTLALNNRIYVEGNTIWFVSVYSWLFKLDIETGKIEKVCKLSDKTMHHYGDVIKVDNRIFIGPLHAQNFCVIEDNVLRKIPLKELNDRPDSFVKMVRYQKYLYLIPGRYPALVRYNMETEELTYYFDCLKEFTGAEDGIKFQQGVCIRGRYLYMASAFDNRVLVFNMDSGKYKIKIVGQRIDGGCWYMTDDGTDFWIVPIKGNVVTRWNPETDRVWEYSQYPAELSCWNNISGYPCQDRPFSSVLSFDEFVLLVPFWSNMFIKIDKKSGKISKWETPFVMVQTPKNCYFKNLSLFGATEKISPTSFITFSYYDRTLYLVDVEKNECKEYQYKIELDFLRNNEYGFNYVSKWLQYACLENGLNTLPSFLNGKIIGKPFDPQLQLELYAEISANLDGTCGEKVHEQMMKEFEP